jgi:glutamate racemase
MLGLAGETVMDSGVAGVTVRVTVAETLPDVALMVVVPVATEVTFPWEPDALLIAATAGADELHSTDVVISCVLVTCVTAS